MVRVEGNRRNLLRLWLCTEIRVLRLDLLHLLRLGLLRLCPHIRLRVLLAGCRNWRSCTGRRRRGLLHTLLPLINLLLPAVRWHCGRLTGNIRSRRGAGCRFLLRRTLPTFSSTRLIRRGASRLTGNICSWGGRRFLAYWSFLALSCTGRIRSSALIRRARFLHRSGLLRWPLLRLDRVCARLCLSRGVCFFRGTLAL